MHMKFSEKNRNHYLNKLSKKLAYKSLSSEDIYVNNKKNVKQINNRHLNKQDAHDDILIEQGD